MTTDTPTGTCQNSECRKPTYKHARYCSNKCGDRVRYLLRSNPTRRNKKHAKPGQAAGTCNHEIPPYAKTCIKCFQAKLKQGYKENKKHYWGAGQSVYVPQASISFEKG
jgi:hypothetical protein